MDPSNIGGMSIQEDEFDFCAVSTVGMDFKEIVEKIKKLEAELEKINEGKQCGGPLMMQIGWQFGEKFGKMEKNIEAINEKIDELKESISKMEKEFAGNNAKMEDKIVEKGRQMQNLKKGNGKFEEELNEKGSKLKELEKGMAEMKSEMRGLKAEIGNKIAGSEGKIDGLKKKDGKMREMKDQQKADMESKKNKLNSADCGPKTLISEGPRLTNQLNSADCGPKMLISEGGRVVKHCGPHAFNSVRAMAIPKFNSNPENASIVYFEVDLAMIPRVSISIGFCTQQFPMESNCLGSVQNSIGICNKMEISIEGTDTIFGYENGYFKTKDVIGIGIAHFPASLAMKCFATCNGQLLGKANLPIKFADLQLFPVVTMVYANDSIRANFGDDPFRFKPGPFLIELGRAISKE